MPVVLLGTLDDPFARDKILLRFTLAVAFEFEVVGPEELLIPVEGLVLEGTNDLIPADLVDPVDPAFQQGKDKKHHKGQYSGDAGNQQIASADGHAKAGCDPDHRGRGDAVHFSKGIAFEDDARADEADAGDDIRGDAVG